MLEKHLYDSWKSRMELYMMNRPHGRMILASVEKGPLVWPSITVDGVTRLKEYTELTPAEAIQADCDIKAINIILQGLPTKIYALVSQANDLWDKIKLLMQGLLNKKTSLVFQCSRLGDDPIDADHINDVILNVLGDKLLMLLGTTRKIPLPGASGSNTGKQGLVIVYNCKWEGSSKRSSNLTEGKKLHFWQYPRLLDTQTSQGTEGADDSLSEHAYWKATSVPALDPYPSSTTNKVEVPKELPKTVEQHRLESRTFEVKMNQVLSENERLLAQAIDHDIVQTVVHLSVNDGSQSQQKDTVIVKLKEQIKSLRGNVDDSKEQGLVIVALKNKLKKLKGKALDKEAIETYSVDPNVSKDNVEPITPKLLNKRTAHSSYIKHTQEEALVLKDIVEHVKANYPQDSLLESAFRYTKVIQDLLSHISRTCPSINNFDPQLVAVTPRKKDKKGVRLSTSASGSQPSGNTRNDKIQQTPSSNSKNKVEAHSRNVKSSLNKRNGTVKVNGSASVQNSKKHDNSDYVCINGDDCMSSDNLCISNSMNDVKFRAKPKKRKSKKEIWKPTGKVFTKIGYIWRPTGRTFTIVGNACPLTRITTTNEVPSRKPIVLESESPKPVVNLVYSRKTRRNKKYRVVS
ncbi:hypothetical protein Tco_1029914 [Tanacetum coccineum]|uniref:Uncharacterized protein n=1 Tax=Tanacetum coccineum TaxID=301880 RepID=A0ABQ5G6B5_9ASTR